MAVAPREATMVPGQQHHRRLRRRRRAAASFCALAIVGTVAFSNQQLQSYYYHSNHDVDEIIRTNNKEGRFIDGSHRLLTHGMTIEHPSAVHGSTLEHPNAMKRKAPLSFGLPWFPRLTGGNNGLDENVDDDGVIYPWAKSNLVPLIKSPDREREQVVFWHIPKVR